MDASVAAAHDGAAVPARRRRVRVDGEADEIEAGHAAAAAQSNARLRVPIHRPGRHGPACAPIKAWMKASTCQGRRNASHSARASWALEPGAGVRLRRAVVAQPAQHGGDEERAQSDFLQFAPQAGGRQECGFAPPLHAAADAQQPLGLQMRMVGLQLVVQHHGRGAALRRKRIQRREQRPVQALARRQRGPAGCVAGGNQRALAAVEPSFGQVVLVAHMALQFGQADAECLRHLVQLQRVPATLGSELQRRVEDALASMTRA
jgi:hypothetical protein